MPNDYYGGQVEPVRSSNRTAWGRMRGQGTEPQRELGRPQYVPQYPAITNQFRNLTADPRTGQLHEPTIGPMAGPVITPEQWMSQHPIMQLGNLFARLLAASPFAVHPGEYRDPYQAPPGVSQR